ncbi:MAG: hydrogen gas-evolving membrane-bound hydrogenase subunit E, partial [Clostridium sp.]
WLNGEKDPFVGTLEMKPPPIEEEPGPPYEPSDYEEIKKMSRDYSRNERLKTYSKVYITVSILICMLLIMILVYAVSYLPSVGEKSNPTNNEVPERYITEGLQETGSVNVVTGMILTYRSFDTFGETTVLFIATCCVMILLLVENEEKRKKLKLDDYGKEPLQDTVLKKVAKLVCPIIFLFGIYIILNGHLSPGGGFSGGAVIGAGMILYAAAFGFTKTQRFFNEKIYVIVKVTALLLYGLIALHYFYTGANGLEHIFPLGVPGEILSGGIILPINICVGTEVACTIYAFYALFRRGGL